MGPIYKVYPVNCGSGVEPSTPSPYLRCTASDSASACSRWPARKTEPQTHFLSAEGRNCKLNRVLPIAAIGYCSRVTLTTPLMLLMAELSRALTRWSSFTQSAYRTHMKMMYAGSPGMKASAAPQGLRSEGSVTLDGGADASSRDDPVSPVHQLTCDHRLQEAAHVGHPVLQQALEFTLLTGDIRRDGARLGSCWAPEKAALVELKPPFNRMSKGARMCGSRC